MLRFGSSIKAMRTIRFFSKNIKIADIQKNASAYRAKNGRVLPDKGSKEYFHVPINVRLHPAPASMGVGLHTT